jgi:hypothetical protein
LIQKCNPISGLPSVLHTLQQTQTHDKTQNQKADGSTAKQIHFNNKIG